MLLLTASKTLLRHPEDQAARHCRDGVFHQIRLSLQLIGVCVTDGVIPFDSNRYASHIEPTDGHLDIGIQLTSNVAIKQLTEMLDMIKMMSLIGGGVQERLVSVLDSLCEMTQDFTDSAFTPHHQREQILDFLEECRFEMNNLISPQHDTSEHMRSEKIEISVERLNRRLTDLRKQLQVVALDQIASVFRANEDQTILSSIKTCSVSGDIDGVEKFLEKFREHGEHLQEVCRLLHHISFTDALHVYTGHSERNLRALTPLTLLAGRTLCIHPSSRIARENLEVFCDNWAANINDLSRLAKDLDAAASGRVAAEKQAYMSLPRPGVSASSNSSSAGSVVLCSPIADSGRCNSAGVSVSCTVPNPEKLKINTTHYNYHHESSASPTTSTSGYKSGSSIGASIPMAKIGTGRGVSYSTTVVSPVASRPTSGSIDGVKEPTPKTEEIIYSTVQKPLRSSPRNSPHHLSLKIDEAQPSAFVKYNKFMASPPRPKPSKQSEEDSSTTPIIMTKPEGPVIMRQKKKNSEYMTVESNGKAPLARFEDEDEETETVQRNFENRISSIIDSLQMEAESLKKLGQQSNRMKVPVKRETLKQ